MTGTTASTRPELTKLTPDNVTLGDLPRFPEMTGWFHPVLLGKLLLKVIVSDVFGQYADRRLIQAALDPADPTALDPAHQAELLRRADISGRMTKDADGAIWLDYAADLGDGFDATYAIAHLMAQPSLAIGEYTLPRGSALVMGGDEVYPTSGRDDYTVKLREPYSFASPDAGPGETRPLLLLPGNHDWYDGLVNFLAIFCRQKATPIGKWRTDQRRSYFAIKLNDHWWIWCIDIALVRDMDQPQADYFVAIAKEMSQGANIILCSAEPGWYKAETNGDSYRSLSYAAWIAQNARKDQNVGKDLKIPLVLSGDSHHYARYSGAGAQYITSGGGGAFLHGTLELKDEIKADWLRQKGATLSLRTTADESHEACDKQTCYPTQVESKALLGGNWSFFLLNREFSFALAGVYALLTFILTSRWHWDVALLEYLALFGIFLAYTGYQENFSKRVAVLSAVHALAHFVAVLLFALVLPWLGELIWPFARWNWLLWLAFVGVFTTLVGSPLAGTLFGLNLLVTCRYFDINHNDAFSAMKLDSHRHFLRIRILGDTLQVYPIALDRVPKRHEWRENPARKTDRSASVFVPPDSIAPHLIEGPVVIRAQHAPSTSEMKSPSELPSPAPR
jgi:hypothetical protein